MMRHFTLFLFLCYTLPAVSQIETKHHMGFSLAADPFSVIRILLEEEEDDYDRNEDYYSEEDDLGALAVSMYYKYKPLPKWDFDAGAKLGAISYGDLKYSDSHINASMTLGLNYGFFTAINYSTQNPFPKYSDNPFFSSLEIGWASSPGDLQIHNSETNETEVIDNLSGSLYFEAKAGFKFGWENNAVGLFIAVNNMINTKSADRQLRMRGLKELPRTGVVILTGISYEFGFRKREKRKKKKTTTTYPDWFQPEEERF